MPNTDFRLRRATPSDVEAIARTHRDSIETVGPHFYLAEIVREWGSGLTPDSYRRAMEHGEAFFLAVDENDTVLGFLRIVSMAASMEPRSTSVAARRAEESGRRWQKRRR